MSPSRADMLIPLLFSISVSVGYPPAFPFCDSIRSLLMRRVPPVDTSRTRRHWPWMETRNSLKPFRVWRGCFVMHRNPNQIEKDPFFCRFLLILSLVSSDSGNSSEAREGAPTAERRVRLLTETERPFQFTSSFSIYPNTVKYTKLFFDVLSRRVYSKQRIYKTRRVWEVCRRRWDGRWKGVRKAVSFREGFRAKEERIYNSSVAKRFSMLSIKCVDFSPVMLTSSRWCGATWHRTAVSRTRPIV